MVLLLNYWSSLSSQGMYVYTCDLHTYTEAYELSKVKELDTFFRDNSNYVTTFEMIDVICGCYIYILHSSKYALMVTL